MSDASTPLNLKWQWKSATITVDSTTLEGYVMHSAVDPRNPDMLCRWAIYRAARQGHVMTALNGRIFGQEGKQDLVKVRDRIERICGSMGHQPVTLPIVEQKTKDKKHA